VQRGGISRQSLGGYAHRAVCGCSRDPFDFAQGRLFGTEVPQDIVSIGLFKLSHSIGIGGVVAHSPLPHHQDMRVRIRRFGR
jgi:hypothetical protein